MTNLEKEMFLEAYHHPKGYPTYADLFYWSHRHYRYVRTQRNGCRVYKERSEAGKRRVDRWREIELFYFVELGRQEARLPRSLER